VLQAIVTQIRKVKEAFFLAKVSYQRYNLTKEGSATTEVEERISPAVISAIFSPVLFKVLY
jgi:hypothetical protein